MNSYSPYEISQDRARNIELIRLADPEFQIIPNEIDFNSEGMQGSIQQLLSDNIGAYVIVEFLIGTAGMTVREGVLASVGRAYILLFDVRESQYVLCDAFSIKFVNFPITSSNITPRGSAGLRRG